METHVEPAEAGVNGMDGKGPVICLEQGKFQSTVREGVARFLAVPYAAPPCGELRWRPPKPPRRDLQNVVSSRLARCPQPSRPTQTFNGHVLEDDEDCLQLNIWAPLKALAECSQSAQKCPVLLYIHGGGGKCHSAHSPRESGHQLALQQGLCVVNINYRLGILGFLAHPELSEEQNGSGNYAILDQIAALQWVRDNIRAFGGDPKNVTLWGLSSGAQYVSTLLVSPAAEGLFHKAMVQSCADLNNVRQACGSCDVWLGKTAEEWGHQLCQEITGDGQLATMRVVPVEQIVQHTVSESANDCYEPAIDRRGFVKPMSSMEALVSGKFHKVPVLLGVTENDGLGKSELEQTIFRSSDAQVDVSKTWLQIAAPLADSCSWLSSPPWHLGACVALVVRSMARWYTLEFALWYLIILKVYVRKLPDAAAELAEMCQQDRRCASYLHHSYLWPQYPIDLSDIQWREYRKVLPLLSLAAMAHILARAALGRRRIWPCLVLSGAFVFYVHGAHSIFVIAACLGSFGIAKGCGFLADEKQGMEGMEGTRKDLIHQDQAIIRMYPCDITFQVTCHTKIAVR
eukprot:symbB.v1.2.010030.t1/scaffold650.1/size176305/9